MSDLYKNIIKNIYFKVLILKTLDFLVQKCSKATVLNIESHGILGRLLYIRSII